MIARRLACRIQPKAFPVNENTSLRRSYATGVNRDNKLGSSMHLCTTNTDSQQSCAVCPRSRSVAACCLSKHLSTSTKRFYDYQAQTFSTGDRKTSSDSDSQNSQQRAKADVQKTWSLGRLNHVAIATDELDATATLFRETLGAKVSDPVDLPEHGVRVVFIELANTKLELLEPLNSKSPVAGFLKRNPAGGIHHICIEVDDVEAAAAYLSQKNIRVLAKPALGAHNKPVIFLHPKDMAGVLTELEQV